MAKVVSMPTANPVCKALGLDPNYVRRLVIDFNSGHVAVAYVEMYVDSSAIEVLSTLDGVKIIREEKERVTDGQADGSELDDVQRR